MGEATLYGYPVRARPRNAPSPTYVFWPGWVAAIVPREWSGDLEALVYADTGRAVVGAFDLRGWPNGLGADEARNYVATLAYLGLDAALAGQRVFVEGGDTWAGVEKSLALALEEGKKAGKVVAQAIAIAAPLVGVIPGLGQGIAMALTAASALALGKPLSEALIDIAANAVPGGALVKAAVTMAAGAASTLVSGGDLGDAGLAALREGARSAGGDMAGAAFDAGVALARGQALQEAGFQFVHRWMRGNDLADKAARFGLRVAEAAANGENVADAMIEDVKGELAALAEGVASTAIDAGVRALLQEPALFDTSVEELAARLHIPIAAAQAAFMAVRETERGLTVDEGVRRRLLSVIHGTDRVLGQREFTGREPTLAVMPDRGRLSATRFDPSYDLRGASLLMLTGGDVGASPPVLRDELPDLPPPVAPASTGHALRDAAIVGGMALATFALVWTFGARD